MVLSAILGVLFQLMFWGAIIMIVVRLISGRKRESSESIGILIRRFFVYVITLGMLVLVGIGVAGLILAAWPGYDVLTESSTKTAVYISFVFVALPVYIGLARYTLKRLRLDPSEQSSTGWTFYITTTLTGSLIASMALIGSYLSELVQTGESERRLLIHALTWMVIWVAHWKIAELWEPRKNTQLHIIIGSTVGAIWAFSGAFTLIATALTTIYDSAFLTVISKRDISDILVPLTILIVGLPVWWWYWLRNGVREERTPLWHSYVLLLGVLGGALSVITGAGAGLFGVLDWFIGGGASGAADHFTMIPGAVTGVVVGGATWAYHTSVLNRDGVMERSEVARIYDYLLSGAGLLVAAGGLTTLIAVAITTSLGDPALTSSSGGSTVAGAVTMLLVGVPIWWRYWSVIQSARTVDLIGELGSTTRRIYVFLLFGATAVTALISLITLVYTLFVDILNSDFGLGTIGSAAIPVALLLTSGALAWYHFAIFIEDREDSPDVEEREEQAITDNSRALSVPKGSLEEYLATLLESGVDKAVVSVSSNGYDVESLEG